MGELTVGSLFSGIGGLELGLERAGMRTAWQVEMDDYATRVLERHWPHALRFRDVRDVGAHNLPPVDVICGGFPCQDISYAGPGGGLAGERSGLWWEFARIIGEMGPRYVVVENVAALLDRGMGAVLGTLSDLGFDAEWSVVSACSVGAPHMRRRVFVVAYANGVDGRERVRRPTAQPHRTLQSLDRFADSRARWGARLADPSALYGGADGLPFGMDRNRCLGNSVAPDVAEAIGRRIVAMEVSHVAA
ncbi:MAG TPA: DNA (cytosine-5-)-methyltransferase [Vulgatibacter sp.]